MLFQFGENVPGYDIRVLNEREARAGAGILLLISLVAFMHVWLVGDFALVQVVIVGFFIDFFIRVLINPRYAPSLVLGRLAVRNQIPEYTGAAQKHFAWALGLSIAAMMLLFVVVLGMRGPLALIACLICLSLLFFETAFGICLGCTIYNAVMKAPAQLCPGGVCEIRQRHDIQTVGGAQIGAVIAFLVAMLMIVQALPPANASRALQAGSGSQVLASDRCNVPDFARLIGHEERWKRHNNCP